MEYSTTGAEAAFYHCGYAAIECVIDLTRYCLDYSQEL